MGLFKAAKSSVKTTLADQWKEIFVPGGFDEYTLVTPGISKSKSNGKGANQNATDCVITKGSKIFVPENTAAFIFSQGAIENIITTAGEYKYTKGDESILNGDGIASITNEVKERFIFGGLSTLEKRIAFINLREMKNIRFGTKGPLMYNDKFYDCDLEILSYGSFSIKIVDPEIFVKNYLPPNVSYYSVNDEAVRAPLLTEFLQSFCVAIANLSQEYRISDLPAQSNKLAERIRLDAFNAGTWKSRFGFEVMHVSIENIEYSPKSKELVNKYVGKKMGFKPYLELLGLGKRSEKKIKK